MQARDGRQTGMAIVEVALAIVVFVLLASAVLAASEMIMSARAKAVATEIDTYRSAYLGFRDRYSEAPGDYSKATRSIPGASVDGDGNGRIEDHPMGRGIDETTAAWEHLARAGFIRGDFVYREGPPSASSAPVTTFGAYPRMEFGRRFAGAGRGRENLNTGNLIPATVLAEVDRKLDDGLAAHGELRYSWVDTTDFPPVAETCFDTLGTRGGVWRVSGRGEPNCGATWLLPP
ncbi:MAG: hypothetical protein GC151_06695 [Betaproteobacteria bacterium]|nr:hypothetical protein [Betaproteobacteria bacterium]